jgi:hypothetical protein
MASAKVTDPARQPDRSRAWFGATVTLADEDDNERVVTLVGEDEADASAGRISFYSPLARAVKGAAVGYITPIWVWGRAPPASARSLASQDPHPALSRKRERVKKRLGTLPNAASAPAPRSAPRRSSA